MFRSEASLSQSLGHAAASYWRRLPAVQSNIRPAYLLGLRVSKVVVRSVTGERDSADSAQPVRAVLKQPRLAGRGFVRAQFGDVLNIGLAGDTTVAIAVFVLGAIHLIRAWLLRRR